MAIGETQKLRQKFLGSTIARSKRQLDEFLLRLFVCPSCLFFHSIKAWFFKKVSASLELKKTSRISCSEVFKLRNC
jgi:hypothetical protein